ncbi:MAG: DinB superfamily protein [Mucilaginibacter sp.]|nr:DinB superfamily protein [Mucilaginibacter sp.]
MSAKKQLLAQYDLHTLLFNNVLADINEEESDIRLVPSINNVKWLAGHLVWGQSGLARIGSVAMEIAWLDLYNTQLSAPPSKEIKAPSLNEIKEAWNKLSAPIRHGLENLPDEALNNPVEFPLPLFNTVEGLWAFINDHQAYTIGQVGILRRALGKEAMKYK